jgi:putative transposase
LILSFRYRVYPNRAQSDALGAMLRDFCGLYNAALQQRIEAFQRARVSLSYGMQAQELKAVRAADGGLARWSFTAEQQVLRRLDKGFKAFFARIKRGDKPGFPRFRASARYHAAEFRVGDGLTIRKSDRIGIVGVPGEIKIKWHRPLASEAKSAILTRQNGKWFVVFHIDVDEAERRDGDSVGIDLGLTSLVALSNEETIDRPNWTKRAKKGLRRRQRALARCKRGSKRRSKMRVRLATYNAKVARKRSDFLHKLSADLVSRFAAIGIEDLNIKGLARGMLAKEVNDAAWAQLTAMLRYKAAKAGGALIEVDPRGTSQTCPECGTIKPKALSERRHRCECGCDLDRDVAAAMVVHFRAHGFWPGHGLRDSSGRVAA